MTSELLVQICLMFLGLFVAGTLACLPIYHGDVRRFLASTLWTKIVWWIPIFLVFCAVLLGGFWVALVVVTMLVILGIRELWQQRNSLRPYIYLYALMVFVGLAHLPWLFLSEDTTQAVQTLIAICFASVLSDVLAFFAGTYAGRHKLPAFINPGKSYEGVAGQVVGAFAGIGLVAILPGFEFSWQFALVIGVASAIGDLANSVAKRMLGIKDWGQTIPGHGGVLDRFSSLSLAIAAGFWLS